MAGADGQLVASPAHAFYAFDVLDHALNGGLKPLPTFDDRDAEWCARRPRRRLRRCAARCS